MSTRASFPTIGAGGIELEPQARAGGGRARNVSENFTLGLPWSRLGRERSTPARLKPPGRPTREHDDEAHRQTRSVILPRGWASPSPPPRRISAGSSVQRRGAR